MLGRSTDFGVWAQTGSSTLRNSDFDALPDDRRYPFWHQEFFADTQVFSWLTLGIFSLLTVGDFALFVYYLFFVIRLPTSMGAILIAYRQAEVRLRNAAADAKPAQQIETVSSER